MKGPEFKKEVTSNFESKDVKPFVSSFSRSEVHNVSAFEQGKTAILLPKEFYEATVAMCQTEKETRGVFLVPKQGEATSKGRLGIEGMLSIGYGSSTSVYPDEAKLRAINKLLQEYGNEVFAIDFHSHTVATGEAWRNKFSGQDEQSIANGVNRYPGYMHVLFTPTNILTFGKAKPKFAVIDFTGSNILDKQAKWMQKFDQYLREG